MIKNIQPKVISFIKKNTEIFLLIILLMISTVILQFYNFQNEKTDKEYLKVLRNTYFKKTLNHVFFNLSPKYEEIDHTVLGGQSLEKILRDLSVGDSEIKKIFSVIKKKDFNKIRANQTINIVLDNSDKKNKKILSLLIPISKTKKYK